MLIGLSGLKGSGKSTIAKYLVEKYNFKELSFANALKDVISTIFQWDKKLINGTTIESRVFRETVDLYWSRKLNIPNFTPRMALTLIGTDIMRKYLNENIWVYIVEKQILSNINSNIVISDCRFFNEIKLVKNYQGKLLNIVRQPLPDWYEKAKNGKKIENVHISEYEHIKHLDMYDVRIENNENLNKLFRKVDALIAKYYISE